MKAFIVIKKSTLFLLSIGCIFCVEIKPMDGWNPFGSLNFRDVVCSVLGITTPMLTQDDDSVTTKRFMFDENTLENIDVCGGGDFFIYQEKDRAQGLIEITTLSKNADRFIAVRRCHDKTIVIRPKNPDDTMRYRCHIYAKRVPVLLLRDDVNARLATNITADFLMINLQERARLLATDKRIKVQLLRISAWGDAQIMKMQGVATRQELFLCDKTQYTSALKSNRVHIDAHEKSKAHIYLEKNVRNPGVIKGRLDNVSELRYSGNPVVRDVRCNHSSLLKCIEQ